MRGFLILLILIAPAAADEVTGILLKATANQLELKAEPDHQIWKFELRGGKLPPKVKKGDRITVDYTAERVAVAQNGQRTCLQFLIVDHVKPATK